jgi:hypothetical protein
MQSMSPLIPGSLEVENASDDDLRSASISDERRETLCVWAVFAGLVLEGVLAFVHPPYASVWARWGSFGCDALVALGVFGELWFSNRISQRDHELDRRSNERVAAANERAAAAEEKAAQLERITAWRRLDSEQVQKLISALRALKTTLTVVIENEYNDPEAVTFGTHIFHAFRAAGILATRGQNSIFSVNAPIFGVIISVDPRLDSAIFVEMFSKSGIQTSVDPRAPEEFLTGYGFTPNLYIFIAPKAPPDWPS